MKSALIPTYNEEVRVAPVIVRAPRPLMLGIMLIIAALQLYSIARIRAELRKIRR
jgi:hypothetical protein